MEAIHSNRATFTIAQRSRAGVLDGDGGAARGRGGEHAPVLLHVDDRRARGGRRTAPRARGRARERDGAEVGERHEPAALLEVLDDPLRVLLAERRLARERVRDRLARRAVLERRRARGERRCRDCHSDLVARGERDAAEVDGGRREPFEPR